MLRRALLLVAAALLTLSGGAASLLASGSSRRADPSTSTLTTSTLTTTTTTVATTTTVPTTSSTTTTVRTTTTLPATTTTPTTTTTAVPTTTTFAPPPPASTSSTAPSTVVFTGHGWGHGVGMSQWGAYGYALHGWTAAAILSHYYSGTTIGTAPGANVRVLLADGKKQVTVGSTGAWRIVDGAGHSVLLPAGTLVLTSALQVNGQTLTSPLTVKSAAPLELGATPYRGRFRVILVGTKLQVVNVVGIEPYLQGVVPSESPSSWPAEALKAQAIAARSYALAELTTVVTASNFDLYSDTRSQVYGGVDAETPSGNAAVQATAHQVVLYNGTIATTFFFSSSGGRTASAADAFGKAIPYLVSVPDPYDTYSPYHNWGPVLYDTAQVAKAIGVKGQQLVDLTVTRSPSGRVRKVVATGSKSQLTLTGNALRGALGLRSSWFSVGWLALDPLSAPVSYGASVTLSGVARGVGGVTLEARPTGGVWAAQTQVVPDASGAFSTTVNPQVTTQYRLTAGTLHAALVSAAVVPIVQANVAAGSVQGTIQPALAGSAIQLQLHGGTGWTTVATGTTDSAGAFAVSAALAPGSYRVRCAPGHGLSPATLALSVP